MATPETDALTRPWSRVKWMDMRRVGAMLILAAAATGLWADDRLVYNARAAARLVDLFQSMDRNVDGFLTREESKGDLNLGARFDDIDINRDSVIPRDELRRYLERRYGVDASSNTR